ncbi:tellurite resistance protein TerC [Streptosporangium becharense]|uniref:Tellurite resistance protein TerC n=1 Tax=Streptosporangium becharense TaxID=1816182 RepID=A0A7W9MFL6_9ACTN|nr:TerC family protein [Streptosporangium becharense]MBB2912074.1 tellurite resistance protein TerC [Streptosporangium becharense]MBB5818621.1 tellurite resistance protein TerC [Streptosporangium becharense]
MTIDSAGAWIVVSGVVVALLVLDFVVAARRPHAVGMREATAWTVFYIGVAIVFGLVLWWVAGAGLATEYFAGWMVEKSLSVDNLFVFVIIMARFSVPPEYQQKVLLFGIATALAMRTVLIVIGAAAISLFSFTFVVFGLLLIWTAVQLVRHRDEDPDIDRNPLVRRAGKIFPMTDDMRGGRLLVRENGKRMATPLFVVFLAIGSTDLLFALDSIPAVFGVTRHPLVVFAANAFALLGLRALYFLIEGLLERLVYLSIGLAVILGFIGLKLILAFLHQDVSESFPEVPTPVSLGVIFVVLLVTVLVSLRRVREHPEERAHAGTLHRGHRRQAQPRDGQREQGGETQEPGQRDGAEERSDGSRAGEGRPGHGRRPAG